MDKIKDINGVMVKDENSEVCFKVLALHSGIEKNISFSKFRLTHQFSD
jgi:hypothetical protein